jgi:hypothetical protein
MNYRFNADEWDGLTTDDRIRRCCLMAEEAMNLADTAKPKIAEHHLRIAQNWLGLADAIARQFRGGDASTKPRSTGAC